MSRCRRCYTKNNSIPACTLWACVLFFTIRFWILLCLLRASYYYFPLISTIQNNLWSFLYGYFRYIWHQWNRKVVNNRFTISFSWINLRNELCIFCIKLFSVSFESFTKCSFWWKTPLNFLLIPFPVYRKFLTCWKKLTGDRQKTKKIYSLPPTSLANLYKVTEILKMRHSQS